MKRAMKVENSVVVNTVETLPTGVKVLTIFILVIMRRYRAILHEVKYMVALDGIATETQLTLEVI